MMEIIYLEVELARQNDDHEHKDLQMNYWLFEFQ